MLTCFKCTITVEGKQCVTLRKKQTDGNNVNKKDEVKFMCLECLNSCTQPLTEHEPEVCIQSISSFEDPLSIDITIKSEVEFDLDLNEIKDEFHVPIAKRLKKINLELNKTDSKASSCAKNEDLCSNDESMVYDEEWLDTEFSDEDGTNKDKGSEDCDYKEHKGSENSDDSDYEEDKKSKDSDYEEDKKSKDSDYEEESDVSDDDSEDIVVPPLSFDKTHRAGKCDWCKILLRNQPFQKLPVLLPEREAVMLQKSYTRDSSPERLCTKCWDKAQDIVKKTKCKQKNKTKLDTESEIVESASDTVKLPGYQRLSKRRKCFVQDCQSTERHSVPKYLRRILLESYKMYTSSSVRVCGEHAKDYYRDWSFLNKGKYIKELTVREIEDMLDLLRKEILEAPN